MQVVIDGFFARFEILDNMFALSTANQMAPHVGKKQKKPKDLKLFGDKKSASQKSEKVVSIAEHKRAKSAIAKSRQQIPWEGSG